MYQLFFEGGSYQMSLLTAELICMLFAAWKAPAWVKEIGLLALVSGIFLQILSMYHAFDVIQQAGDISPTLLLGGFKVSFITIMYGMLIYGASLVIRMLQKPKSEAGAPTLRGRRSCPWFGRHSGFFSSRSCTA